MRGQAGQRSPGQRRPAQRAHTLLGSQGMSCQQVRHSSVPRRAQPRHRGGSSSLSSVCTSLRQPVLSGSPSPMRGGTTSRGGRRLASVREIVVREWDDMPASLHSNRHGNRHVEREKRHGKPEKRHADVTIG
jgi:hypothetical protein